MELHQDVYDLFYLDLLDIFRQKDLLKKEWDPLENSTGLDPHSQQLWKITRSEGNRCYFVVVEKILSKYGIKDPTIFNRYRSNYNSDAKKKEGKVVNDIQDIRDKVLLAGLNRLGFIFDNTAYGVSTDKITRKLFADYLVEKKHFDVFEAFPELKFEFKTLEKDIPENKQSKTTQKQLDFKLTQEEIEELQLKKELLDVLQDYFECINKKDYKGALKLWNPEAMKYQDNYDVFYREHYFIEKIEFVRKNGWILENGFITSINLIIRQDIRCYVSDDVKNIFTYRHRESNNGFMAIHNLLKRIINKAEREGFYLANEPIEDFLNFYIFEKIHTISAYNQDKIKRVFPDYSSICTCMFLSVDFLSIDNKFLIDNISCDFRKILTIEDREN